VGFARSEYALQLPGDELIDGICGKTSVERSVKLREGLCDVASEPQGMDAKSVSHESRTRGDQ